jgi:outer membrane lipopolysaccharide assembly protein LptE/RlpB
MGKFVNYHIKPLILPLCISLMICFLPGCGFHLNNTHHLSEDFSSTQIQLQQDPSYGNFYRTFYALSKQSGVIHVPRHVDKAALSPDTQLLWLSEPQFNERPLSYSSDGQANYVMIELTLPYKIRDSKDHILSDGPIIVTRPMSISPNALLNNDSQRALVKEALTQKACIQLLQRLNTHASVSS